MKENCSSLLIYDVDASSAVETLRSNLCCEARCRLKISARTRNPISSCGAKPISSRNWLESFGTSKEINPTSTATKRGMQWLNISRSPWLATNNSESRASILVGVSWDFLIDVLDLSLAMCLPKYFPRHVAGLNVLI